MTLDDIATVVSDIAGAYRSEPGALLPLLHALQDRIGWIPEEAVAPIAAALNLSRAEVHGTISFYHDFRRQPPARHTVKFCRAESCRARGGMAIERLLSARLGRATDGAGADRQVAVEAVYCLGLCASGPNALVDGVPISRIDAARVDAIADLVAA